MKPNEKQLMKHSQCFTSMKSEFDLAAYAVIVKVI